ncbi:MAG: tetratricopeptide repeat protein [Tannerella sp.]|jgi:tetratricopeptide (TPR) repeat protein|nr:tetratricopeptide repeat protein [Tannerella sp.]
MRRTIYCIIFLIGLSSVVIAQEYEQLINESYEHAATDNYAAAEECLKAAMRIEPGNRLNYALLTNLGTLQRRQGKLEEALMSYSAALGLQPDNELTLMNRAELYTQMNDVDKAIYDYNTLLAEHPNNEQALFNRGLLYIRTGEFVPAEQDFENIIKTNEGTFLGRFGYAILEKARGNFDDSEAIFNYLADKYKDNVRVLEERAELYFLTKRNYRAITDINKVFAAVAQPSAEMYMLRGRIKLAQYEKESAAIDFRKAAELGYDKTTVDKLIKECL